MNDTGTAITLRREMSISHAEFFRSLTPAIEPGSYRVDGDTIRVETAAGAFQIRLSPQAERRLGALVLPVTMVELRFPAWTPNQVQDFLVHFDRCFQRGGG